MLLKNDFARNYANVKEGTGVRCRDGEKLGKISAMNNDYFVVHKGIFFGEDFAFRYDDIVDSNDGEVTVNAYKTDLVEWRDQDYPGWSHVADINEGRLNPSPREEFRDRYPDWDKGTVKTDEIRVPVVEEKLEAQKTSRQAGEVRLRKIVHTELKHFTVPVMKEKVNVERVPVAGTSEGTPAGSDTFQEKTVAVPIMEEEVTVTKRPVVKEEVRVQKNRTEEQRDISDKVRKEEVQIDEDTTEKRRNRV